jgi:head-tail adaptor
MAWPSFVKIVNGFPSIDIGKMRHAITIQKEGPTSPPTTDVAGPAMAWNPFTTADAAIDAVRGTDVIKGGQTTTQLFLTVAIWFQAGILPNMRVLNENGSIYVIQSVENVMEMNTVMVLNCLAIGANE